MSAFKDQSGGKQLVAVSSSSRAKLTTEDNDRVGGRSSQQDWRGSFRYGALVGFISGTKDQGLKKEWRKFAFCALRQGPGKN